MSDQVYTIKKIGKIGEFDPKYGQKWWGTVEEAQFEISFNSMDKDHLYGIGDTITFEERLMKQTIGSPEKPSRDYIFLKKVRPVSGSQGSGEVSITSPQATQVTEKPQLAVGHLEEILKIVKENNQILKDLQGDVEEKVIEDIGDEPVNLSDIPF